MGRPNPLVRQVGGDHYTGMTIQPAVFSEANGLSFLEGDVIKRIARYRCKGGKGLQDLEKAIHDIEILIQLRYTGDDIKDPDFIASP